MVSRPSREVRCACGASPPAPCPVWELCVRRMRGSASLSYAKKNKFGFIKLVAVSLRHRPTQTPCPMSHSPMSPVTSRKVQHLIDLAMAFGLDCVTSDAEFSELSATEQMFVLESL